jgi:hypothetical protein
MVNFGPAAVFLCQGGMLPATYSSRHADLRFRITDTDGEVKEVFIPPLSGDASIGETLQHIIEFKNRSIHLTYTGEDQRDAHFATTLRGNARQNWSMVQDALPIGHAWNFANEARAFMALISTEEDKLDFIGQIRTYKKPRSVTVETFYNAIIQHHAALDLLDGNVAGLTAQELRQVFFNGHPIEWKANFLNAKLTVTNTNNLNVKTYMLPQERASNKAERDSAKRPHSPIADDDSHISDDDYADDETCPIHVYAPTKHTWGECNLNPKNRNQRRRGDNKQW